MQVAVVELTPLRPFDLVRQVAGAGHRVIVVTSDLAAYLRGTPAGATPLALAHRVVQARDTSSAEGLLAALAGGDRPDVLITVSEQHTLAVAAAARTLGR